MKSTIYISVKFFATVMIIVRKDIAIQWVLKQLMHKLTVSLEYKMNLE